MPSPVRVAILECDTPVDSVKEARGTYGDIFRDLLEAGLSAYQSDSSSSIEPTFTKWDVVTAREYPDLLDVDVILLSGSKYNSFDDDPWILELVAWVRQVYESKSRPLVGICFGHQIIARGAGAQVARSPGGWEVSVCGIQLNDLGRDIFGSSSLDLHQMHRDAVLSVPAGTSCIGSSPECAIQGLYERGRLLTLQAHPEFNGFIMRRILETRHEQGIFDDAFFGEAASRADNQQHGVRVAASIWKFILDC